MTQNSSSRSSMNFPTTHWTLVEALQCVGDEHYHEVLRRFLERYTPAMAHYLATSFKRLGEHEREDVLQQFITDRLLVRRLLEVGGESPVSFRRFLVACLRNFAISYLRKHTVRSRHLVPEADFDVVLEDAGVGDGEDRVDIFDAIWALEVIREAAARTEEEFLQAGRQDVWDVFYAREYIAIDRGLGSEAYEQLAERLGQPTDRLRNLLVTGKRAYGRHLRAVVGQYVAGSQTAEDEIRDLMRILASGTHLAMAKEPGWGSADRLQAGIADRTKWEAR